jgi:chromate reductase
VITLLAMSGSLRAASSNAALLEAARLLAPPGITIDWLVSGFEMPSKPVALFNASPRASEAQAALRLVLSTIAARLIDDASLTLPLLAKDMDARAIAADSTMAPMIVSALEAMAIAW